MKRYYIYIIGIVLLLAGCDKEDSDNGKLDGFWQMTKVSIPSYEYVGENMRSSGLTWSIQGHILEFRDVNYIQQDIIASFEHKGDSLIVSNFLLVDRDKGDTPIEDQYTYLLPYGIIENTRESFKITELTSSRMVLDNQSTHLEFRKY